MRDTNVIALSPPPSSFHPAVISVSGCPSPRMAALRNIARPRSSRWSRYIAINRPGGAVRAKCSPISSPPRYSPPPPRSWKRIFGNCTLFFLSFFFLEGDRIDYDIGSTTIHRFLLFLFILQGSWNRVIFVRIFSLFTRNVGKCWKMVISFFSFFLFWCSFGFVLISKET